MARLSVAKDTDGGVNVKDESTGLIVSVIATDSHANVQGIVVEVWDFRGRRVERTDWTRGSMGQELRPGQVQTFTIEEG